LSYRLDGILSIRTHGLERELKPLSNIIWKLRIWRDTHAQDLIEYALMAGFVAVAAGAIMPGVSVSISKSFSKVSSSMTAAASTS